MNTKTIRFEKGRRYPTEVANLVDDLFDEVIFNQCYLPFSEHKECIKSFTVTITVREDEEG